MFHSKKELYISDEQMTEKFQLELLCDSNPDITRWFPFISPAVLCSPEDAVPLMTPFGMEGGWHGTPFPSWELPLLQTFGWGRGELQADSLRELVLLLEPCPGRQERAPAAL